MYERDYRAAWTPMMAHYFPTTAATSAHLADLTPVELAAVEAQLEQMLKAGAGV